MRILFTPLNRPISAKRTKKWVLWEQLVDDVTSPIKGQEDVRFYAVKGVMKLNIMWKNRTVNVFSTGVVRFDAKDVYEKEFITHVVDNLKFIYKRIKKAISNGDTKPQRREKRCRITSKVLPCRRALYIKDSLILSLL